MYICFLVGEDSESESEEDSDESETEEESDTETSGLDLDVCPPGCDQVLSNNKFTYTYSTIKLIWFLWGFFTYLFIYLLTYMV